MMFSSVLFFSSSFVDLLMREYVVKSTCSDLLVDRLADAACVISCKEVAHCTKQVLTVSREKDVEP